MGRTVSAALANVILAHVGKCRSDLRQLLRACISAGWARSLKQSLAFYKPVVQKPSPCSFAVDPSPACFLNKGFVSCCTYSRRVFEASPPVLGASKKQ